MKHGANIYKYAKKLRCKDDEIFDFSSNINSYQPKIDLYPTNSMIVKYADKFYKSLKKSISKRYNINKNQIALYNGATSAIFELMRTLKEEKVYLYAPLYGEYEKASKEAKKKIYKIDRFKNLYKKPKKNSIVIFVNPSTPDGKYYNLKKLFKLWEKQNCYIILDESFLEFEKLKSFRGKDYDRLYIIQSFSKFYSCAGVRVGAIFSNQVNIKQLQQPLWHLSSFDVSFLQQRMKKKKFIKTTQRLHKINKKELYDILKNSNLFEKIYKSDSNFFLTKSSKADKIFKHLLTHKILSRDCDSFDFLDNDYLRFGVKNKTMHLALKKALSSIH